MSEPVPTHLCPCGCDKEIERYKFSCNESWIALPPVMKEEIRRTAGDHALSATRRGIIMAVTDFFAARRRLQSNDQSN